MSTEVLIAFVLGFVIACLFITGAKKTRTVGGGSAVLIKDGLASLPATVKQDIEREIRNSNKIAAIKIYKEHTGANLRDSKQAVEFMEDGMFKVNE